MCLSPQEKLLNQIGWLGYQSTPVIRDLGILGRITFNLLTCSSILRTVSELREIQQPDQELVPSLTLFSGLDRTRLWGQNLLVLKSTVLSSHSCLAVYKKKRLHNVKAVDCSQSSFDFLSKGPVGCNILESFIGCKERKWKCYGLYYGGRGLS